MFDYDVDLDSSTMTFTLQPNYTMKTDIFYAGLLMKENLIRSQYFLILVPTKANSHSSTVICILYLGEKLQMLYQYLELIVKPVSHQTVLDQIG